MQTTAKNLSDVPAINRFLSYCRVRTVPSKTVMIHAGDLPDVLYYIVDGSVEVMIEDEDGNEMVLAYLNKGQFFGEMGLFLPQPRRSVLVRTRSACQLAEILERTDPLVDVEQRGLAAVARDRDRAATFAAPQAQDHWHPRARSPGAGRAVAGTRPADDEFDPDIAGQAVSGNRRLGHPRQARTPGRPGHRWR